MTQTMGPREVPQAADVAGKELSTIALEDSAIWRAGRGSWTIRED